MQLQKKVTELENVINVAKDVMTLEEAALFTGLSKSSLYKLTYKQVIPHYKPNGKLIFFEKTDCCHFLMLAGKFCCTAVSKRMYVSTHTIVRLHSNVHLTASIQ